MQLEQRSRAAVLGAGPAGSLFSYFLLQMARRNGLDLHVDIYESRDFSISGPSGCNMCGGIISESLVQSLAAEGIELPPSVIRSRIDSYFLHTDLGSVRIETPLQEKRIAAVHRGGGPRGTGSPGHDSFDAYLLGLAVEQGARLVHGRVDRLTWWGDRPEVGTQAGEGGAYDLLAVAVGVNSAALKLFEGKRFPFKPPRTTKAYICELPLGDEMIRRYLGHSMHVFLLDIPRLEFAAIIPKRDYATVCLLGHDVDRSLVESFLGSPEVRECLPPHWRIPDEYCHCFPRINVGSAVEPFSDRLVFIGDCATTRLYKDGIGAAYRTAKAAAVTAVFEGIGREDFRLHYWPVCRRITSDNRLGRIVFAITRQIQRRPPARRGLLRMVQREQGVSGGQRQMSTILWDTFTGSAPYRSVFLRGLKIPYLSRLLWNVVAANRSKEGARPGRRIPMASGGTGFVGRRLKDGDVIYHQGERGDCMYVVQTGEVEIIQRKGNREFCLEVLGKGDFFGEMALFQEEIRSATVRAVGDTCVYTLERVSLLRRIHEDPSLAFRLLERMSRRIRELESALVGQASVPA